MENKYFVSQQDKLKEQKKIIESFIMYLSTITKAMDDGEYNFKMINDICTIIQDYYSNNDETLEEEESEEKESEEKSSDSIEMPKINSNENSDSSESEEEAPKLELVTEKKNMNLDLYEEFINSNYDLKKMLCKPNYDVEKNINTFVSNSNKY
jgi:hypothetical protein